MQPKLCANPHCRKKLTDERIADGCEFCSFACLQPVLAARIEAEKHRRESAQIAANRRFLTQLSEECRREREEEEAQARRQMPRTVVSLSHACPSCGRRLLGSQTCHRCGY